jgi:type IV pilus assembly protein PilF
MIQRWLVIGFALMLNACAALDASGNRSASDHSTDSYTETAVTARARAHSDLGAAYFQQNNYEVALSEFKQAIQIDANYAPAYNGLAMVRAALGEDAEAEKNFTRSIQIQPNNSESHNNFGIFLCARQRYDESISHFLSAVKNPLYATPYLAYANAGICSVRKNDIKNAEIYFNKALAIEPLTHSAAQPLADIQFKRGDVALAKKTLQNALLSNPSPETLWLGIRIERILGDKDNEASYALLLRQRYPDSPQTRLLLSGK